LTEFITEKDFLDPHEDDRKSGDEVIENAKSKIKNDFDEGMKYFKKKGFKIINNYLSEDES